MTANRWSELMRGLGLDPHPEMFDKLFAAYSEPHRRYHTVAHIEACLREFDGVRQLAQSARLVELALWFHDAVYAPAKSDNERRSADLAAEFLAGAGLGAALVERVRSHVMATVHAAVPADPDAALVVDVDLSILGQNVETYAAFEQQIRAEYEWVPRFLYRRKRAAILRSFLERESIYGTGFFRDRYEAKARVNLERAIGDLSE